MFTNVLCKYKILFICDRASVCVYECVCVCVCVCVYDIHCVRVCVCAIVYLSIRVCLEFVYCDVIVNIVVEIIDVNRVSLYRGF